jgi:hypothetical protein
MHAGGAECSRRWSPDPQRVVSAILLFQLQLKETRGEYPVVNMSTSKLK